jgi:hypothetical protein
VLDPRFIVKGNVTKHIKDYSFLYPKNMIDEVGKREQRRNLEDELVREGKTPFFMKTKNRRG